MDSPGHSGLSLDIIHYPCDVAPAQAADLASQGEIAGDLGVRKDAEAIHDGAWAADPLNDPIGVEVPVLPVPHRQDHGRGPRQGGREVLLHSYRGHRLLVAEEAGTRLTGGRIGVLVLQLVPVVHIGVVDPDLGRQLRQAAGNQLRPAVPGVPTSSR
jgi:hypothetical protein